MSNICIICKTEDDNTYKYCSCNAYIHEECLIDYIDQTKSNYCPYCTKIFKQDIKSTNISNSLHEQYFYQSSNDYTYHPVNGIDIYSFSLNPIPHQPKGFVKFSQINKLTIDIKL
jgi:hypothetical protein